MIDQDNNNQSFSLEMAANYKDIVDNAHDLIQCVNSESKFVFVNQAWLSTLGYTAEEINNITLWDIIHIDSMEHCRAAFEKVLAGNNYGEVEAVFVTKDGNQVLVEGTVGVKLDENGRFVHTRGIFRDVTGQKQADLEIIKQDALLQKIFDLLPVGLWFADETGKLLRGNPEGVRIWGGEPRVGQGDYGVFKARRLPSGEEIAPDDWSLAHSVNKGITIADEMLEIEDLKGQKKIILNYTAPVLDDKEKILGAIVVNRDITVRMQAEEALRASELILKDILETTLAGFWDWNLVENTEYLSPTFKRMFGYEDHEMESSPEAWQRIIFPEDLPGVLKVFDRHVKSRSRVPFYNEVRYRHKDGSTVWVICAGRVIEWAEDASPIRMVGCHVDITERKKYEAELKYLSYHDQLTGLYNRHFLEEEMKRLDTQRQLPISVIMADVNGLKLVNDTYSHNTGDALLKRVAVILKSICRDEDILARFGGDEFVLYLPHTSEQVAKKISERIEKACRKEQLNNMPLSLSTGVAVKVSTEQKLSDLLSEAEDKMYRDKLTESRSGKSAVVNTLLQTLAAKSFETEVHTRNMQKAAKSIGEKLGLPHSELHRLNLLITLHDIGKINIPEAMLTKKASLSTSEWEVIKTHPEVGYRIARATNEFAHVAEDILAHHERWDGSGYPLGLKGEAIPILARIAAIADAFEVMSNGRPYKKVMTRSEIVAELKNCSGTQFDPELVELFLSVLEADVNNSNPL